jgi:hypothetical protein
VGAQSLTENRELLDRTARALTDQSLEPADLRRLLARVARQRAIDPGGLVRALGLLTVLAGIAFGYIIEYHTFPHPAKELTPFLFPAVLLGTAIVLDRNRRPRWEVELAAMTGEIVLGLTFLGASGAWGRTRDYGLAAALLALGVSIAMYVSLRLVRLTAWAAGASIVALTSFIAVDSRSSVARCSWCRH